MKSVRSFIAVSIVTMIVCIAFASCEDESGAWYTLFTMKIDSLSAPAEVLQTDTLRITFYSEPMSCCYNFYRYDLPGVDISDNTLRIRITGRKTHNLPCSSLPRVIEMEYEVTSMLAGYYYIQVYQPDGSVLRDSVLVDR